MKKEIWKDEKEAKILYEEQEGTSPIELMAFEIQHPPSAFSIQQLRVASFSNWRSVHWVESSC